MSDLDVKIQDVANYWDYNMPMMAVEECGEVIQAISKVERAIGVKMAALKKVMITNDENDDKALMLASQNIDKRKEELKDEIRDVYISLRALMYYYNIEDDIMERVEKKLNKKYKED